MLNFKNKPLSVFGKTCWKKWVTSSDAAFVLENRWRRTCWWHGVAVTRFIWSTKLLYTGPG